MIQPPNDAQLDALAEHVDLWLAEQLEDNPVVMAVDRDPDGPRSWFVRVSGEEKDVFSIRFHLQDAVLHDVEILR